MRSSTHEVMSGHEKCPNTSSINTITPAKRTKYWNKNKSSECATVWGVQVQSAFSGIRGHLHVNRYNLISFELRLRLVSYGTLNILILKRDQLQHQCIESGLPLLVGLQIHSKNLDPDPDVVVQGRSLSVVLSSNMWVNKFQKHQE